MKEGTRARVAAIVAAAKARQGVSAIYDYSTSRYRGMSVEAGASGVSGYDYASRSHFSGGGSGSLDFYDYETRSHVQLKLDGGGSFSGYDYHTRKHYSGTVNGRAVSLYDYETSRYYNYTA